MFGASSTVLVCRKLERTRTSKAFNNQWTIVDFAPDPSRRCSWRFVEASWAPLGPSSSPLRRLGATSNWVG
eukprot:7676099-Pyramimonas_sp.AAC.1